MSEKSRRREAAIGLANNASGAAFGVIGTKAVYDQQKGLNAARKLRDAGEPQKVPPAPKVTRIERGLKRIKVKPKYVLPALAATAVGGQVANAAMDAQSAAYFARELKPKKGKAVEVKKSREELFSIYVSPEPRGTGHGVSLVTKGERVDRATRRFTSSAANGVRTELAGAMEDTIPRARIAAREVLEESLPKIESSAGRITRSAARHLGGGLAAGIGGGATAGYAGYRGVKAGADAAERRRKKKTSLVAVGKAARKFDAEADRQRRLGLYQGAGLGAAGVLGTETVRSAKKAGLTWKQLKALGGTYKKTAGLGAGAVAGLGVSAAALKRSHSAKNDRWT